MPAYWWQCPDCKEQVDFQGASGTGGIAHFIRDVLIPSDWDQSNLAKECNKCGKNLLRISYIFPRDDKIELQVKHIVGISPSNDVYVPMMWETIPNGSLNETWFDFKYINNRSIWGLNKPAVFTNQDLKKIFNLYKNKIGCCDFP